jgi:hypothetical protein
MYYLNNQAILEIVTPEPISTYSKSLNKIFEHNSLENLQNRIRNPKVFDYINTETNLHKKRRYDKFIK